MGGWQGVGTWAQKGYRWYKGALGDPRGVRELLGGSGGVRGVLGAGRECKYSGARRGIGGIGGS